MEITIPYIKHKFEEFNQQMFAGKLPMLPIKLSDAKTFLGVCTYKKRIGKDGKVWSNPATAQEVFDVSGAGDTVIAVFTLALAGGIAPEAAAYLATGQFIHQWVEDIRQNGSGNKWG